MQTNKASDNDALATYIAPQGAWVAGIELLRPLDSLPKFIPLGKQLGQAPLAPLGNEGASGIFGETMYRVPQELERLLREAGAKPAELPTIRWIIGHWSDPENWQRNIAELRRNQPDLFHGRKNRG